MNKKIFNTKNNTKVSAANTKNAAGGIAYKRSSEEALAQYAVTNCFNGTFYTNADQHFKELHDLVKEVSPEVLADIAVYARKHCHMKDMPAYLLANLLESNTNLFKKIFDIVIDNGKMLSNFVQIIRSGAIGRKSFGRAAKSCIQKWFDSHDAEWLFKQDVGISPKFADIIRLTHPNAGKNKQKQELFKYFLGYEDVKKNNLPSIVKAYEKFKSDKAEIPNVPFQLLTALDLTDEHWKKIAENAPWQMTRMNLNTFMRHKVFDDKKIVDLIAKRLANPVEIAKSRVFPYQLMNAYLNINYEIPTKIKNALQDAMELAVANVPEIDGDVYICIDTSGSMGTPITGNNGSATSAMRCIDVAALFGTVFARKVKGEVKVIPFDTTTHKFSFNSRDSIMTLAKSLSGYGGGGTDCSCALREINKGNLKGDAVIYVSDNMSWVDYQGHQGDYYGNRGTGMATEWKKFKQRNPNAKLVLIDLNPNTTSQVETDKNVLNVGGFSDSVFKVVGEFVSSNKNDVSFVEQIKQQIAQDASENEDDE